MTQPSVRAVSTGTATTASLNVTKPTGTTTGDVLLAFQSDVTSILANMTTPTGGATWQLLSSRDETGLKSKVWWKVAGASEPANYGFAFSGSTFDANVTIIAVQDGSASTPTVASVATGTGTSINTPGITPPDALSLEIRYVAGDVAETTTTLAAPATYTEVGDLGGIYTISDAAHKQLADGTATSTLAFTTDNAPSVRHGFTVAIAQGSIPATINAVTVDATTDIPAPSLHAGATASPVTVDATTDIPSPTVTAVTAGLVNAVTVTATADIPSPTITAVRQSVITPATVDATADIPSPTVSVAVLPGAAITQDGQVEWGGVLWGAGTSYKVLEVTGWVDQKPKLDDLSVEEAFRHGALAGASYAQRRIVTVKLQIDSLSDPSQVWSLLKQLRYDTRTLRDNTLWTLVARGYTEMLLAHGKVIDRTGVMDRDYSIGAPEPVITIMCPDPRCYSLEQQSTVITALGTETLVNDGDCYTSPIIRFSGPCVNPAILNETLDRTLAFDLTLTSGQRLDVDTQRGTVKIGEVNHMGDLADAISVPPKEWFLDVGSSVITYETDSGGTNGVEVIRRSAHL